MDTLLLWDIDGTVLASGGSGMAALRAGLRNAFGIDRPLDDIDFAGRTDRWIIRQIFARTGHEYNEVNLTRMAEAYFAELPARLAASSRILPGVEAALDRAAAAGYINALLTGNLVAGAKIKLDHHGLWSRFAFGAFANDSETRDELGPHALQRARAHLGRVIPPQRVFVIGDTPHDVACGRVIGARTIAVKTGYSSRESLVAAAPDLLIENLASEAEAFFAFIAA